MDHGENCIDLDVVEG